MFEYWVKFSLFCLYFRHGKVSSNAIRPTWISFSSTISMEERLSFALYLMKGRNISYFLTLNCKSSEWL